MALGHPASSFLPLPAKVYSLGSKVWVETAAVGGGGGGNKKPQTAVPSFRMGDRQPEPPRLPTSSVKVWALGLRSWGCRVYRASKPLTLTPKPP